MRHALLLAAAALSIAAAGCSKNDDVDAANADMDVNADLAVDDTGVNADANAMGAATGAEGFVTTMAGSDLFEIESGKLAEANAINPDLKAFGKTLQADHSKSSGLLKAAAAKASPPATPPAALPADLQAKLDALKAAKGAAFDTLFLEQQGAAHGAALATLKAYASGGDQAPLKEFATAGQPMVQMHLDKLNGWKK